MAEPVRVTKLVHMDTLSFGIVDMHAITAGHDPSVLAGRTLNLAAEFFAAGIDPERSILFVQSHLGDLHAEMTWLFDAVTGVGELQKMPQFREKSEQAATRGGQVTAGLLTYPVLQTSDILLYAADEVPVGEDQRHHIEIARDIGGRFNHRYGDVFTLPRAVLPQTAARVMDLQDPLSKMSKSTSSDKGLITLRDQPAPMTAWRTAAQGHPQKQPHRVLVHAPGQPHDRVLQNARVAGVVAGPRHLLGDHPTTATANQAAGSRPPATSWRCKRRRGATGVSSTPPPRSLRR